MEADIAADSAVAAFATTMTVAKKLMALSVVGLEPRPSRPRDRGGPGRPEGSGAPQPEAGLDLVPAIRTVDACGADASASERLGIKQDSLAFPRPAGVVPLLQALGRTVATHAQAGYESLQEDPRFWTLLHLLQRLGRPTIAPVNCEQLRERSADEHVTTTLEREASDPLSIDSHHDSDTRRTL
jgi:hypothetical protein